MDWYRLLKRRWQSALHLSWQDWWTLWQAWVGLLAVDLGLRLLPFGRVQGLLASRAEAVTRPLSAETTATVRRLRWLVEAAGQRHLHPMRCLQQALVLQWLLGRRGIQTELKIGVRKEEEQLCAHAWLELGHCSGERPGIAEGFAPLSAVTPER
jgi:hypothetical protein